VVNWTSYNESLVRRGEVILDFDIIDGWYAELERMNEVESIAQKANIQDAVPLLEQSIKEEESTLNWITDNISTMIDVLWPKTGSP